MYNEANMISNRCATPFLLRANLTARFASFARLRGYGYASSQELTNRTRQLHHQEKTESRNDC
jgi:hypothetical protein